jgi:uncharacterized protein YbjT (DUF2867 family)
MTRVVDVSNSASFEDVAVLKFFEASTRNLLAQEAAAGVRHHVALSVVGTERLSESGYFRAEIAQEKLIKGSSILYSIVHATFVSHSFWVAAGTPQFQGQLINCSKNVAIWGGGLIFIAGTSIQPSLLPRR